MFVPLRCKRRSDALQDFRLADKPCGLHFGMTNFYGHRRSILDTSGGPYARKTSIAQRFAKNVSRDYGKVLGRGLRGKSRNGWRNLPVTRTSYVCGKTSMA